MGFPDADRTRPRGRAATGPDTVRGLHHGAKDCSHGGPGESAGDSALLVERSAHRRFATSGSVSAARRVCGIQHVARSAKPYAGETTVAPGGWVCADTG